MKEETCAMCGEEFAPEDSTYDDICDECASLVEDEDQ